MPRHQTKSKHKEACEKTIDDLFAKYNLTDNDRWDYQRRYESHCDILMKFNGNTNMFDDEWRGKGESYRAFDLNKAYEKVMNWNISRIILYIIEIRTRYGPSGVSSKFHYSSKYDKHLYEFCDKFLKYYYGEEDANKFILEVKRHIFNDKSKFYERIINYIQKQPELKRLRAIYRGTCSISKETFISKREYALA